MNYAAHYDQLMARARNRVLTGYRERHHVVPKCIGGGNAKDNIVELTAEEHYVSHQLLVKMYPGVRALVTAVVYMAKQCSGNKAYGWLRRKHSAGLIGHQINVGRKQNEAWRAKVSQSLRGNSRALGARWHWSAEKRAEISERMRGNKHTLGLKKPPMSEAQKEKIAASLRGRKGPPKSQETIEKIRAGNIGKKLSPETKAKLSAARLGKCHTQETKEKISKLLQGNTRNKGRKLSAEHRANISAGVLARFAQK